MEEVLVMGCEQAVGRPLRHMNERGFELYGTPNYKSGRVEAMQSVSGGKHYDMSEARTT